MLKSVDQILELRRRYAGDESAWLGKARGLNAVLAAVAAAGIGGFVMVGVAAVGILAPQWSPGTVESLSAAILGLGVSALLISAASGFRAWHFSYWRTVPLLVAIYASAALTGWLWGETSLAGGPWWWAALAVGVMAAHGIDGVLRERRQARSEVALLVSEALIEDQALSDAIDELLWVEMALTEDPISERRINDAMHRYVHDPVGVESTLALLDEIAYCRERRERHSLDDVLRARAGLECHYRGIEARAGGAEMLARD